MKEFVRELKLIPSIKYLFDNSEFLISQFNSPTSKINYINRVLHIARSFRDRENIYYIIRCFKNLTSVPAEAILSFFAQESALLTPAITFFVNILFDPKFAEKMNLKLLTTNEIDFSMSFAAACGNQTIMKKLLREASLEPKILSAALKVGILFKRIKTIEFLLSSDRPFQLDFPLVAAAKMNAPKFIDPLLNSNKPLDATYAISEILDVPRLTHVVVKLIKSGKFSDVNRLLNKAAELNRSEIIPLLLQSEKPIDLEFYPDTGFVIQRSFPPRRNSFLNALLCAADKHFIDTVRALFEIVSNDEAIKQIIAHVRDRAIGILTAEAITHIPYHRPGDNAYPDTWFFRHPGTTRDEKGEMIVILQAEFERRSRIVLPQNEHKNEEKGLGLLDGSELKHPTERKYPEETSNQIFFPTIPPKFKERESLYVAAARTPPPSLFQEAQPMGRPLSPILVLAKTCCRETIEIVIITVVCIIFGISIDTIRQYFLPFEDQ